MSSYCPNDCSYRIFGGEVCKQKDGSWKFLIWDKKVNKYKRFPECEVKDA